MQVTKEQIDPCKIALTISVDTDKVTAAREKAFAQAAKGVQIPGFRKGKVPPQMARAYVDEGRVKQRAAEMLVNPAYMEALAESQVEPFAGLNPELEMVDFPDDGPFVFKAMVPLRPVVTLGPYKGLDLELKRLIVGEADVDRQIEEMRTRQAEYPEVTDRNAQVGDVILADLQATVEGQETPELVEPRATVIEIGKNIPDFDNGLVGMAIGESKSIEALYPETFADAKLSGKRATFNVTINELRARVLPEINEEFLNKVRPGLTSGEELRSETRESLVQAAAEMSENDLEFDLVARIVDNSQVFFPDALLRAEMQTDINELSERLKREQATLDQYLRAVGKTQQDVQNDMAQAADRRIRNSLVLSEIARTEEIGVEDADVDAAIAERAERAKVSPAAVRAFIEKNDQLNQVRDQALTEKILTFLRDQSHITEREMTREEMQAAAAASTAATAAPAAEVESDGGTPAPLEIEESKPKARRAKTADVAAETESETNA
jgi:trigger factor